MLNIQSEPILDYVPESLEGKSVVITGGSTGIGRATAVLLASKGANVLTVGLDPEHVDAAMEDIKAASTGGKCKGIVADLSNKRGIEKTFQTADRLFDKLDILINNVGVPQESMEGEYGDWERVINVNLLSYIACANAAYERMKQNKSGHIVQIGSMSSDLRTGETAIYSATKAGVQAFSEAFGKQINPQGVRVSLIEPGLVGTDFQPDSPRQQRKKEEKKKMLKAEDIAASVFYVLTQPSRCEVVEMKIRPVMETE